MTFNPPPFELYEGEKQVLKSRPWISTVEFSEKHFKLVTGPYKGQNYRVDKSPIGRLVMELWDRPLVRKIFWCGPSQVTKKSTTAYACMAAEMYRDPCSCAIGMPDKDTRNRIFDEKIGPHFKMSPKLREMLSDDTKAVQTGLIKTRFGAVYGMYSGSDASASSISPKIVLVDESDAYQDKMARARMIERNETWEDEAKTFEFSKVRGNQKQSVIWQAMMDEAQVIYEVRAACPNCGALQVMEKQQIKVPPKMRDPKQIFKQRAAWYECIHCGMHWNDHYRNIAVSNGDLWAENDVKDASVIGLVTPSWVFPGMSLSKVMADWFIAYSAGTPKKLEWWDNSHASKPYKVITIKTKEEQVRAMVRPDRPPMEVPTEAMALTMGVDSQKKTWFFVVRAWARSGESWLIDYGELMSEADVETQLDAVYPIEGREDVVMPIWRSAIDIGGTKDQDDPHAISRTLQVKLLVKRLDRDDFRAIKGASRKQEMTVRRSDVTVDKDVPKEYQETMPLFTLDTEDLKDLIFMVRMDPESLQPMWMHRDTGDDYFRQMTNEERNEDGKWVEKGANHLLDCEVYAAACAHIDWAPVLQLLPEPTYRKVARPSDSFGTGGVGLSPLAGRNLNPFCRGGR